MITRAPGSDKTHPCRVLIVEDHVDTRDLLVRLLSDAYDVRTAGCYESALTAAAEAPPQVVIADVRLPGKDGVELMRELRQRYQVPGIAVTGQIPEDPGSLPQRRIRRLPDEADPLRPAS